MKCYIRWKKKHKYKYKYKKMHRLVFQEKLFSSQVLLVAVAVALKWNDFVLKTKNENNVKCHATYRQTLIRVIAYYTMHILYYAYNYTIHILYNAYNYTMHIICKDINVCTWDPRLTTVWACLSILRHPDNPTTILNKQSTC